MDTDKVHPKKESIYNEHYLPYHYVNKNDRNGKKLKENKSSIKNNLNLLTPGRDTNPPDDVTFVPAYHVWGAGK